MWVFYLYQLHLKTVKIKIYLIPPLTWGRGSRFPHLQYLGCPLIQKILTEETQQIKDMLVKYPFVILLGLPLHITEISYHSLMNYCLVAPLMKVLYSWDFRSNGKLDPLDKQEEKMTIILRSLASVCLFG